MLADLDKELKVVMKKGDLDGALAIKKQIDDIIPNLLGEIVGVLPSDKLSKVPSNSSPEIAD